MNSFFKKYEMQDYLVWKKILKKGIRKAEVGILMLLNKVGAIT